MKEILSKISDNWQDYRNHCLRKTKGGYMSRPSRQQTIAGKKLYLWEESVTALYTLTPGSISGGTWTCKRILEVNDEEKVISWQWSGNNCPFGLTGRYKNWPKKLSN